MYAQFKHPTFVREKVFFCQCALLLLISFQTSSPVFFCAFFSSLLSAESFTKKVLVLFSTQKGIKSGTPSGSQKEMLPWQQSCFPTSKTTSDSTVAACVNFWPFIGTFLGSDKEYLLLETTPRLQMSRHWQIRVLLLANQGILFWRPEPKKCQVFSCLHSGKQRNQATNTFSSFTNAETFFEEPEPKISGWKSNHGLSPKT